MVNEKKLLQIASDARNYSYTPYSKFRVGAALLTESGKIFAGCNVENATYGATCCAERTAIFKAISEGERDFKAIAIKGDNNGPTFPCGICRQVMAEFAPSITIILDDYDNVRLFSLEELLPHTFKL